MIYQLSFMYPPYSMIWIYCIFIIIMCSRRNVSAKNAKQTWMWTYNRLEWDWDRLCTRNKTQCTDLIATHLVAFNRCIRLPRIYPYEEKRSKQINQDDGCLSSTTTSRREPFQQDLNCCFISALHIFHVQQFLFLRTINVITTVSACKPGMCWLASINVSNFNPKSFDNLSYLSI